MSVKTALVFPGQGSQRPGMLEHVPETDGLDRLLDAAEALSGLDLCAIATDGDDEQLADTRVAQPLLYLADWAWGVALMDSGITPAAVAGHSLGELAALAVAGVYSVEAGLELVVERSRAMAAAARASEGTMAAVLGMDAAAISSEIGSFEGVWVANDNAPGQIVISGTRAGVAQASERLAAAGARRIVPLKVAGAFHTPIMEPARSRFAEVVAGAHFSDARIPIYQNTEPSAATDAETIRTRLLTQIIAPVRWTETMTALSSDGVELLVEAGPGAVLAGLARRVEGIEAVSAESAGIEHIVEEVIR